MVTSTRDTRNFIFIYSYRVEATRTVPEISAARPTDNRRRPAKMSNYCCKQSLFVILKNQKYFGTQGIM